MKKEKNISKIIVAALLMMFLFPQVVSAVNFNDIPNGYWATNDIYEMANLGYVVGAPDGNFYPENPVTRAEFAAMIVKSLKLTVNTKAAATFSDVPKSHWAFGVIDAVNKAGFIKGYKGKYRPNDKITRQEMAVVVMQISSKYGYSGDGSTTFIGKYKDSEEISDWALPSVGDATEFGYISEVSYSVYESTYESYRTNRVLAPQANATRAQATVAIHKVLIKTGLV